jgi:AraC-like DNA-binding protein/tetratricopeptide (TPR) repeat protein
MSAKVLAMSPGFLPHDVKLAMELIQHEPARPWALNELAGSCRAAPRTLQRHFRRFAGQGPIEFLRGVRLDAARRRLLSAGPQADVTSVATSCGFTHLGRFAGWYAERYGESPSRTLRRNRAALAAEPRSLPPLLQAWPRPGIAVLPFDLIGPEANAAAGLAEEIGAALCRHRWISVTSPDHARYHLCGKVRADRQGRLRVTLMLHDVGNGRLLWADSRDGLLDDVFTFEDRVSVPLARLLLPVVREAEVNRAQCQDPDRLDAWGLTMRALPNVLSVESKAAAMALEGLERAMELAPGDGLPVAMAAWCRGRRASRYFTADPEAERQAALRLVAQAGLVDGGDPLTEVMLAAACTLAHDLEAASRHTARALALDGGSAWAWGRSGWDHALRGRATEAIERFQIARSLAPSDPLSYSWCTGIGSSHFVAGRYEEAARWYRRVLVEQPKGIWVHRFLAASYMLANRKEEATLCFAEFARAYPELSIAQVTGALPYTRNFQDRVAEGLEGVGMRSS